MSAGRAALASLAAALALAALPAGAGAEQSWGHAALSWSLVEAGPRERSLIVAFVFGGCERRPAGAAVETSTTVSVSVTAEEPQSPAIACPDFAEIATRSVPLEVPLHGRRVLGGEPGDRFGIPMRAHVPRVIGLAPGDAAGVLEPPSVEGVSLREAVRRVRGPVRLARVVAQYPAPGAAVPADRVVRVTVVVPGG